MSYLCRISGTHSFMKLDPTARREWDDTVVAPMRRLLEFFHRRCITCYIQGNGKWESHSSKECETSALCDCDPEFTEFRTSIRVPNGVCFGCWVSLVRRTVPSPQIFIYLRPFFSVTRAILALSGLRAHTRVLLRAWCTSTSSGGTSSLPAHCSLTGLHRNRLDGLSAG